MMAMPIVVKRTGAIAAGPLNHHKGILYADIEEETARRAPPVTRRLRSIFPPRRLCVFRNLKVNSPGQPCGLNPLLPIVANGSVGAEPEDARGDVGARR
jgi:hypothetical protein